MGTWWSPSTERPPETQSSIVEARRGAQSAPDRPGRHNLGMVEVTPENFEVLVGEALDEIPKSLLDLLDNVVIAVEDESDDPDLLGVYEGIPITERGTQYAGVLPDRIVIYRLPTLRMCNTLEDVVDEVHITVVHEIAHHFGSDDDRLAELGYD